MHVYLVRHAHPENMTEIDPGLSQEGVAQARMLGKLFAALKLQHDAVRIVSSPMQRARQTATCLCEEMGLADDVFIFPTPQEEHSGGNLKDLLMKHLLRITTEEARSEVIVVGHYPTMSQSFAWLAGQTGWSLPSRYGITACLTCRESFEEASGALAWLLPADLLLSLSNELDVE